MCFSNYLCTSSSLTLLTPGRCSLPIPMLKYRGFLQLRQRGVSVGLIKLQLAQVHCSTDAIVPIFFHFRIVLPFTTSIRRYHRVIGAKIAFKFWFTGGIFSQIKFSWRFRLLHNFLKCDIFVKSSCLLPTDVSDVLDHFRSVLEECQIEGGSVLFLTRLHERGIFLKITQHYYGWVKWVPKDRIPITFHIKIESKFFYS